MDSCNRFADSKLRDLSSLGAISLARRHGCSVLERCRIGIYWGPCWASPAILWVPTILPLARNPISGRVSVGPARAKLRERPCLDRTSGPRIRRSHGLVGLCTRRSMNSPAQLEGICLVHYLHQGRRVGTTTGREYQDGESPKVPTGLQR
jgi:hypothetical protein